MRKTAYMVLALVCLLCACAPKKPNPDLELATPEDAMRPRVVIPDAPDQRARPVVKSEVGEFKLEEFKDMPYSAKRFRYGGHKYIMFSPGYYGQTAVHDPDCECKK
jgi:hypothetical protein